MKGTPITPEQKQEMINLAKSGKGYRYIAAKLHVSISTVSKNCSGYCKEGQEKLYSIPDYLWAEWDMVTKSLRRYFKRSNS